MEHQHETLHCAGCHKPIANFSLKLLEGLPNPIIVGYRGKEYFCYDGAVFHLECARKNKISRKNT